MEEGLNELRLALHESRRNEQTLRDAVELVLFNDHVSQGTQTSEQILSILVTALQEVKG